MGVALSYLCGNRNSSACRIERQKLEVRLLPGPFVLLFYILDCNLLDVNLCLLVAASKNIGGGKTASWVAKQRRGWQNMSDCAFHGRRVVRECQIECQIECQAEWNVRIYVR